MINASKVPHDKLTRIILIGYLQIFALIFILILWSTMVPLAESSLVQGFVTVGSKRQTITHLEGGKVETIYAQIGDVVSKGQNLVKIDDQPLQTELNILEYQLYSRYAALDRLQSERDKRDTLIIRDLLVYKSHTDPNVGQIIENETRNFEARASVFEAESALLDSGIERYTKKEKNLLQQQNSINRQIDITNQQIRDAGNLISRGFATKTRMIDLQRERERLTASKLSLEDQIGENLSSLEELNIKKSSHIEAMRSDIEMNIIELSEEAAEIEQKILLLRKKIQETTIRANSDGIIVDLFVKSSDDVVLPASPIMEIVPQNSKLLVEAGVPPHEIDGVNEGAEVEVRFPAFGAGDVPSVKGQVSLVSADVITDDRDTYYRVHIAVNDWNELGDTFNVIPGMPTEIIIMKESRTLLAYLFGPLTNHIAKAFL